MGRGVSASARTPPGVTPPSGSIDGGGSWRPVGADLDGRYVLSIAIHPESPSIVLAGTTDGIYVSFDVGEAWKPMNEGFAGNDWVRTSSSVRERTPFESRPRAAGCRSARSRRARSPSRRDARTESRSRFFRARLDDRDDK